MKTEELKSLCTLIPEVYLKYATDIEERKVLKEETIAALIKYENETMVPILQETSLSKKSYNTVISLALSVLETLCSFGINLSSGVTAFSSVQEEEEEEMKRAWPAAKVLPELANIRPEEEKRVLKQMKEFYPVMKKILSKDKNKELKDHLQKNKSISSDTKEALGLN